MSDKLRHFDIWAIREHEDYCVVNDAGYTTLKEYVHALKEAGGIYDPESKGWIPYHRINYVKEVTSHD
jgi:hypothetical protein